MSTFEQEMAELEDLIRIEDEQRAVFDATLDEAIKIGKGNAHWAIDQRDDYDSWEDAKDGCYQNVLDTLHEQCCFREHPSYGFFIEQALKAFDAIIAGAEG